MLFTKFIRGMAAGARALAALGAHAHTVPNTPLEKIPLQSSLCAPVHEAQVIDVPEENAFVYGDCVSGTTINPYRYVDPDGRNPLVARLVYGAAYAAATEVGAATLGGLLGIGLYELIHMNESAEPPRSEPKKDGQGATDEEKKNSSGGDTEGKRVSSGLRDEVLEGSHNADGTWTCWRCGGGLSDPGKIDIGHKNVPRSKGGNLHPDNLACEGQACNRSAGNRGEVKPGSDCVSKGCAKPPEPQVKPPEKPTGG